VIIGLLLGGILKGQELITSARVRNLISQQDGIKAGFYGFQDRYRAFPGDYKDAPNNLGGPGAATAGNGDGRIDDATNAAGTKESILVWDHLSRAGFLNGNFVYAATIGETTTPKNPYGAYLDLAYDKFYGDPEVAAASAPPPRHNLKTGAQIPVEIAAEVDRKTDDGNPFSGSFQFSVFAATGTVAPTKGTCIGGTTSSSWKLTGGTTEVNCGGATLL
jgi:hypothetical protein